MTDVSKIVEAIDRLTNATQYSLGTYSLAMILNILPVLLGALVAYYFTNRHWKKIASGEVVTRKALELCTLIDELNDVAIKYALSDSNDTDEKELVALEVQLKTTIPHLSRLAEKFKDHCLKDKATRVALEKLSLDLYEVATGDNFEARPKEMSSRVAYKAAKMLILAKSRLSTYTIRDTK